MRSRTHSHLVARLFVACLVLVVSLGVGQALAVTSTPHPASASVFGQIDEYVEDQMDGSRIPGAAIAIVEGDDVVYARGYGDDAITPDTPFPIGSLTKSFTAVAVMQLVEAGTIDLDAPLRQYIPWFHVADASASGQITVRHLLNQTSGFSRQSGITPIVDEWDGSTEEYVRRLADVELNRPVGASYEYSNVNFVTLGLLISEVSGQPYADYVQQHILDPLGMTKTYTSIDAGRANGMTDVHRYWFGVPIETDLPDLPGQTSTGYIVSSAHDMGRYLSMHLNGGTLDGTRILSEAGIASLHQPATNEFTRPLLGHEFTARYAMGWFSGNFGEQAALWHLGDLPSFTAWMVLLPETDRAVVVLMNASSQLEIAGATEVFSRIPIGVTNLLGGYDPPSGPGLTNVYLVFNLIVFGIIALQFIRLFWLIKWPRPLAGRLNRARFVLPFLWEVGLSLLILIGYPATTGMGWRGVWWSLPDLTLVLLIVSALWLLTATIRTVRLVRPMIERHEIAPRPRGRQEVPAT